MRSAEIVLALVVLGTAIAVFADRLRVPPPSLLVIAGLLVGLLPGVPAVRVSPDVVSFVVLPPLLWAATSDLPGRDLRAVWRPVTVLAVGLVLASAAAVAVVLTAVAAVPVSMAFVLGAVLASTDPVAVSALGRRLSLPPRVQALVQAESLFNDGTSLVLFKIAVSFAAGSAAAASWGGVLWHGTVQFVALAGGGALAGGLIGAAVILLRSRITDPVMESVVALVTPYAAYVAGEQLHVSGVTAVIVAGLVVGSRRTRITTPATRLQVDAVYQTVIFLLESVVFALIGLQLPVLVRDLNRPGSWPLIALAIAATLVVTRVAWVFPLWAVRQWRQGQRRPSWTVPAVISWAGTRGVVPLAAALSIPLTAADGTPLPQRDLLLVLAVTVIVISLITQGLTLEPLVRRTSIAQPPASTRQEEATARLRMAEAGLARLDELAASQEAPTAAIDRMRQVLDARAGQARAQAGADASQPSELTEHDVRRDVLTAQGSELARLYADGAISAATCLRLQRTLDLELTRLSNDTS
ncbi:MAG TPA: Na+/H+ antiporter [Streptosporangiaceae bacterium]|nr:Na+/H+ antiporter [Streptosporangiaceae bacterium]